MADNTPIEWTDATWNPTVGCSLKSPGCKVCYAMGMAARIEAMTAALKATGGTGAPHYDGTTKRVKGIPVWTGKLALAPDHILTEPLRWKRPRKIFVNSMSDLFHEDMPVEWIDNAFAVMALAPQHTFQVLTKRADRMRSYICGFECDGARRFNVARAAGRLMEDGDNAHDEVANARWPLPNVWLGVSAEDQARADERIPDLLATPAAVRWVSAEPLLGQIDVGRWIPTCYECGASCGLRLTSHPDVERCTECGEECGPDKEPVISEGCPTCGGELEPVCPDCGHYMVYQHPDTPMLDWIVAGGESGRGARPMHPDWARSIRDQCAAAGVPFLFKQWGAWGIAKYKRPSGAPGRFAIASGSTGASDFWLGGTIVETDQWPRAIDLFGGGTVRELVGKKAAGRLLDGVEHNGFPEAL